MGTCPDCASPADFSDYRRWLRSYVRELERPLVGTSEVVRSMTEWHHRHSTAPLLDRVNARLAQRYSGAFLHAQEADR